MISRRTFAVGLGAALAWPPAARAQQKAMSVIGYLNSTSPEPNKPFLAGFRQGLSETGYIEGQNLVIEFRWAEGHSDQLPALARNLVGRRVDVIAASGGDLSARAAKGATSTIPIVSVIGGNPVAAGLVASLARPGSNLTGISFLTAELNPKRLELLSELVPQSKVIAVLVNPSNPQTEGAMRDLQAAARAKAVPLSILKAGTESEIDAAFASFAQLQSGGLVIAADAYFNSRNEQLVTLTSRHGIPTISEWRGFPMSGGLISYGTSLTDVYRQVGVYAGKILNGAKPADLPVQQPTKFELVINLKTAKALGLTVPLSLLARADEVIE